MVEALAVTLRMVVAEDEGPTVTMELDRVAAIPVGALGEEKVTVPENPFRLETVKVEVRDDPWLTVRLEGLGVMLKSGVDGGA